MVLPQKPEKQEETNEQVPTDKKVEVIKVCKPVWHVLVSFAGEKSSL